MDAVLRRLDNCSSLTAPHPTTLLVHGSPEVLAPQPLPLASLASLLPADLPLSR